MIDGGDFWGGLVTNTRKRAQTVEAIEFPDFFCRKEKRVARNSAQIPF